MIPANLLAKGWTGGGKPPDSVTLLGHHRDVRAAARQLLQFTATDQLRAMHLAPDSWSDRLAKLVLLAGSLHDLGKANDHFQGMVRYQRGRGCAQAIRHEWVGLLILIQPGWREWLAPALAHTHDWDLLLWCIAGHHREPPAQPPDGSGSEMRVFLAHQDVAAMVDDIRTFFALPEPPASLCSQDTTWTLTGTSPDNPLRRLRLWEIEATQRWHADLKDANTRRLLAAAKGCLIAADVGGSALPREGVSIPGFIAESFSRVPTQHQLAAIVRDRLTPDNGGAAQQLRPFQQQIGESRARVTFVRAGCGSGKTIAAYHWAATQHPGKRLYFCYPTTGTATEGFRDYLFDSESSHGKYGAELFHGRAHVDLELILDCSDDDHRDTQARLESLDAWSAPIVSCTVDTVLGLVQNSRRGLYAWPALAGSAFIFDEVHAYDHKLFNALLEFLTVCRGVPVLLMSASLPETRLGALKRKLQAIGETLPDPITGPADLEDLPRYRRLIPADNDPISHVVQTIRDGGKVLWVLNTVRRAMTAYDAAAAIGLSPMLYHSHFRYEDRVARHRDVIEAFRSNRPSLAICTQVAEMSLDISADMLVTDLAPVPSLIQRLGRLNRRARPPRPGQQPPPAKPFIVVEPRRPGGTPEEWPYKTKDCPDPFDRPRQWLSSLPDQPLSQSDLARAWEDLDTAERFQTSTCNWVGGGPLTIAGDLRDASPGLTVLLPDDAEIARKDPRALIRLLLPMGSPPKHLRWQEWRRIMGIPVPQPEIVQYSCTRGGGWV